MSTPKATIRGVGKVIGAAQPSRQTPPRAQTGRPQQPPQQPQPEEDEYGEEQPEQQPRGGQHGAPTGLGRGATASSSRGTMFRAIFARVMQVLIASLAAEFGIEEEEAQALALGVPEESDPTV